MLRIYHSNRLDVLEEIIEFIISEQPLQDPFATEYILVQSNGMAQWLQMALAQKFGIAANIQFPLPASFIWQLFSSVLPPAQTTASADSAFTRPDMCWKLMTLLPSMLSHEAFAPLRHYLHEDKDQRKLFQLCQRVADLYDQYLIYRPHWIRQWEAGQQPAQADQHQRWQALLWQALTEHTVQLGQEKWHRANLCQRFISRMQQPDGLPDLPSRIFICGISSLPPMYLQALQALGHHCDVHLMVTNPCRFYWGDIRDAAALSRLLSRQRQHYQQPRQTPLLKQNSNILPLITDTDCGNPLLASWGKQGRDYIYLLAELSHFDEVDAFADIPRDSLLHHLQADLLDLHDGTQSATQHYQHIDQQLRDQQSSDPQSSDPQASNQQADDSPRSIDPLDCSLSLHICHSPQREIEVLHDQLLAMLERDPALNPRDIIVMLPDIDSYYPFIQAVFAAASGKRHIPYAISDRRTRQLHPLFQATLSLLSLPDSRFGAEEILQLLEVPALASRFQLDESGLRCLRQWISESGIRWGADDDNVREWRLPATGQHTWRFGLQRMLLGYAMDSRAGAWQSLLPYDESSGLSAELVGQLAELLQQLDQWRKSLASPRLAQQWLAVCRQLIDSFFTDDPQTSDIISLLEQQWQAVISPMLNAQYAEPVPLTLLREQLEQQLEQQRFSQRFLAGAVNFCTLMPMRSIPFKVICLAGMNDGVYPRPLQPLGFDLMRQQPMPGDRSRRDDDRYLLLEALTAAQQILYISYTGYNIQDNQPCFPSVLVQELLDYIGQSYWLAGDETLSLDQRGQGLLRHISIQHSRMPFDADCFRPDDNQQSQLSQQSYASQWLPAAQGQGRAPQPFIQPLAAKICQELDIDSLQRFWQHPVRSFFQMRLKVSFSQQTAMLEDNEPFSLDALQGYQLDQQLINALVEQQQTSQLYQQYRGSGQLPFGAFGDLVWQKHCASLQPLADIIRQQRLADELLEIDQTIDGIHLTGWLTPVQADGLLRWHAGSGVDARHGIRLWLEHLLCCASGRQPLSRLYSKNKKACWRFLPLEADQATAYLQSYLRGYQQGLNQPLILLPKCATAWLNACYDQQTRAIDPQPASQSAARNKLTAVWAGNNDLPGEGADPWYQRLWQTLDEDYYQQIIDNAQTYLLPLWQHHQPES